LFVCGTSSTFGGGWDQGLCITEKSAPSSVKKAEINSLKKREKYGVSLFE
jgi:hypothetical protein